MEIFGVGILEVILILVIAVIVLGPEGMVKAAQSIGRFMRKVIKSPIWAQLMDTQRELREMPTRLVREAGLEEDIKELKKTQQDLRNVDIKATAAKAAQALVEEPIIAPPSVTEAPVAEPVEALVAEPADTPLAEPVEAQLDQDGGIVAKPIDTSLAEHVDTSTNEGPAGAPVAEPVEAPVTKPDNAPPPEKEPTEKS